MKKEVTDIVFLLDRSGSMSGLENDTIKSYNNYLERMKSQNVRVTTVLFDDKYEFVTEQTNIKNVKKMDKRTYYTRGSTALLDAIGKTIKYLDNINPKKVFDRLKNLSEMYYESNCISEDWNDGLEDD